MPVSKKNKLSNLICLLAPDVDRFFPIPRVERRSDRCVHTPVPVPYNDWQEFAERACKTHAPVKCLYCGLWKIWLPKPEARRINREDRKRYKEFFLQYRRWLRQRKRRAPVQR